jgi:hypothetical protein
MESSEPRLLKHALRDQVWRWLVYREPACKEKILVGVIVDGDRVDGASGGEVTGVALVGVEGANVLGARVVGDRVVGDKYSPEIMIVEGAGLAGLVLWEPAC